MLISYYTFESPFITPQFVLQIVTQTFLPDFFLAFFILTLVDPGWNMLTHLDRNLPIFTHLDKFDPFNPLCPIITCSVCFLKLYKYHRSPSIIVVCRKTLQTVFLVKTFICDTLCPAAHSSLGSSNTDSYL